MRPRGQMNSWYGFFGSETLQVEVLHSLSQLLFTQLLLSTVIGHIYDHHHWLSAADWRNLEWSLHAYFVLGHFAEASVTLTVVLQPGHFCLVVVHWISSHIIKKPAGNGILFTLLFHLGADPSQWPWNEELYSSDSCFPRDAITQDAEIPNDTMYIDNHKWALF